MAGWIGPDDTENCLPARRSSGEGRAAGGSKIRIMCRGVAISACHANARFRIQAPFYRLQIRDRPAGDGVCSDQRPVDAAVRRDPELPALARVAFTPVAIAIHELFY